MIALGIDAGASSSRWLLLENGRELGRGRGPAITGHVFAEADRAQTLEHVAALAAAVRQHGAPDSAVAGITGLDPDGAPAQALAAELARVLGIPKERILVTHDVAVAYREAFEPGEGIVVYAGTGSIAYHEPADPSATAVRVGGHGYLIDDAGGGFWIGRQALRTVLRERDRLAERPTGPLANEIFAHVGSDLWEDVRSFVYGGGRAAVASLTVAVDSAARAGDEQALAILQAAGAELGRLANVMSSRLSSRLPVALMGGVIQVGEPLFAGFVSAMPEKTVWRSLSLEPVEAAARLAGDIGGSSS